jgi:hypothetical protein
MQSYRKDTFQPAKYGWDKRDLVSTVPVLIGKMLCAASVVTWAWRALP